MTSYIRLTPAIGENNYLVFQGKETTKKIGTFRRADVTPFVFASFSKYDFPIREKRSVSYYLDSAFFVGSRPVFPREQYSTFGTANPYESGIMVVGALPCGMILDYISMKVVEALPRMNVRDTSEAREAQNFVREYHALRERTGSEPMECLENTPMMKKYIREIGLQKLISILETLPKDMEGRELSLLERVGLVIAGPEIPDKELTALLASPVLA